MLPGMGGEEVLEKIRGSKQIPVIIVSAKDSLDSKVGLLTAGAEDYIITSENVRSYVPQDGVRHDDCRWNITSPFLAK